jgi:hypothetical protein
MARLSSSSGPDSHRHVVPTRMADGDNRPARDSIRFDTARVWATPISAVCVVVMLVVIAPLVAARPHHPLGYARNALGTYAN